MRYIKEILRSNRSLVTVHVLLGITSAFLANYKAFCFQDVVNGLTNRSILLAPVILYGAVILTACFLNYLDEFPSKKLEHGIFLDFKMTALRKVSTIDYAQYQQIGTGQLTSRIENGSSAGKNIVFGFWLHLLRHLIPNILFSLYFLLRIDGRITFIILCGYVFIFIFTNLLMKTLYAIKKKIMDSEEQLNHFLIRGFMEMVVFRFARQFPSELKKASDAKTSIVSSKVKMNMLHEAFFAVFAVMISLLNVGILVYAWKNTGVSVGNVVAMIQLIENAYTPIAIFNILYVQYKLDKTAYGRLCDFFDLEDDLQLTCGKNFENSTGCIKINNLTFRYDDRLLFENLSLNIEKGEKVAFVGESGSGKTTLAKLIAGLLKYDSGSIIIGDSELRELRLDSLYEKMIFLTQDSPVFDGTVRENLVFDSDISDSEVEMALDNIQLGKLLSKLPKGIDTRIGERGSVLSGGEKQRLSMARLLIESPDIVILDEATSAMDNITEAKVIKTVTDALSGSTVIAIAHRLSSVSDFDRIVLFRNGRIEAQGTFEHLAQHNSYFGKLLRANK